MTQQQTCLRLQIVLGALLLALTAMPCPVYAYIGPGAGFAFLSSFLAFFLAFLLAFLSLLIWPIRCLRKLMRRRHVHPPGDIQRVVIVGLDGLDPQLTQHYMAAGKMPNFTRLRDQGCFTTLETTYPAISPVAWSSFMTGVNPSRHNIYDFLSRNLRTYMPELSSSRVQPPKRTLSLGKFHLPLGKPVVQRLRRSQPFWKLLGDHGVFSAIIRVPITFPPEKFSGVVLSAMCTPDLLGTQGTFACFTTAQDDGRVHAGGVRLPLHREGKRLLGVIEGPENPLVKHGTKLQLPFTITPATNGRGAEMRLGRQRIRLRPGEYTPWIRLMFRLGLWFKISGICRFYVTQTEPEFSLYMTPINIDPEKPVLPISYPFYYAYYLAKLFGSYSTLGLAEDTWALNERVIDEAAFLKQCALIREERERMLFKALQQTRKGLCVCVFDDTDRIQHMFFRYLDPQHPANAGKDTEVYRHVIEEVYTGADALVGRVLAEIDAHTLLIVMSDHGFVSFKRGVNLNVWLRQQGYLQLHEGTAGEPYFQGVNWAQTRAYTFGLGGLYINQCGREAQGIVAPGAETQALKHELMDKLRGLRDPKTGEIAITELYDSAELYDGPYASDAPDFIVGYNTGYRTSWDAAIGTTSGQVFEDNTKSWSGDHCTDPHLVPGVLLCNRHIDVPDPSIMDIAPTVLRVFGVDIPAYMDGKPFMHFPET